MKNGTAVTKPLITMRQFGALTKMVASSQCDYVTQSNSMALGVSLFLQSR